MDDSAAANSAPLPPPTLGELPPQSRLEEPHPGWPGRDLDEDERRITRRPLKRNRPDVDRRHIDRLTASEVRVVNAFVQLRKMNPRQQPTLSELAYVLGRSVSTVHQHVQALCRKGVFVRLVNNDSRTRRYAMTPEAAARPHLAALARVATKLVKLTPERLFEEARGGRAPSPCNDTASARSAREEYEAVWALARSILTEITVVGRVMVENTCAALDREEAAASRARVNGSTT